MLQLYLTMESRSKKVFVFLLAIAVIAVVAWLIFEKGLFKIDQIKTFTPLTEYTKTDLGANSLSEVFPKNLIQEKNPRILEIYKYETKIASQYNLKYISEKTFDENIAAYQKYFDNYGWKITGETGSNNSKMFVSTSLDGANKLIITVSKDQTFGTIIVEASFGKNNAPVTPLSQEEMRLKIEKDSLLANSVIKIGGVTQSKQISIDQLPQVIRGFADQGEEDLIINQVQYDDGSNGYEISYVLSGISLADAEKRFQISFGDKFELLKGQRAETSGFSDYKNSEFGIEIIYFSNSNGLIMVNIKIINIK